MTTPAKPQLYRDVIDSLVEVCKSGQGQIGPYRVRKGLWNAAATADFIQDQHEINLLLARLTLADREILAGMLEHAFQGGVFESLKALGEFEIEPFVEGYEGEAYHDFIGRIAGDWEWPES
jgi:hypothetical protein